MSKARSLSNLFSSATDMATDLEVTSAIANHEAASNPHTGYVLKSILDSKGDLVVASEDNTPAKLSVGIDGQVLVADSSQTNGIKWGSPTQEIAHYSSPGTYTYTPPSGTDANNPIYARVVITGGGGGGSASTLARSGSGGSAGQQIILPSVKITAPVSITVGAGGAGSTTAGTAGSNGASTIFGSVSALGGAGGAAGGGNSTQTSGMPASSAGAAGVNGGAFSLMSNGIRYSANAVNWTLSGSGWTSTYARISQTSNGKLLSSNFSSSQWYVMVSDDGGVTWNGHTGSANFSYRAFAFGNGIYVAVGDLNGNQTTQYMTSATATSGSWTSRNFAAVLAFTDVRFGGGNFVAIGSSGSICYQSTNGTTWTSRNLSASSDWYGLAFGNGTFVATSYSGTIVSSSNGGVNWTTRATGQGNLRSVSYLGNKFITRSDASGTSFLYSTDGATWTSGTLPVTVPDSGSRTYYSNTYYWIFTGITLTSTDGITWTVLSSSNGLTSVWSTSGDAYFTSLGTVSGNSVTAQTNYFNELTPTGGSGGNATSGAGSGGLGGNYISPSGGPSTGSADAQVGQVPGAGGGGGGAVSTSGGAGANGIVSIYL